MRIRRNLLLVVAVLALAVFATACGSSGGSSSATSSSAPSAAGSEEGSTEASSEESTGEEASGEANTESVGAQTGALAEEAKEAGEKAATESGKPMTLPSDITVGLVQGTDESEVSRRTEHAVKEAVEILGWKSKICVGQGVPTKIGQCAQSLVDANVNVILSNANEPAYINRALRVAKEKEIPFFNVGGDVPSSSYFAGSYVPNDAKMGEALNELLFKEMEAREGNELAIQDSKAVGALVTRREALQKGIEEHPEVEVVAENETDFANPTPSVTSAVRTVLTAHPDTTAFWGSLDFDFPVISHTAEAMAKGGELPIIVGFFGDKANLALIEEEKGTGVVEVASEADSYIALDQYIEMLTRKVAPSQEKFAPETFYSLDFGKPTVVTKENLPPKGQYVEPPADFVTFFSTKWGDEFGIGK
jgi:ABC-type sugar transport system substrate-binding protein